mmetsp:Transcript_37710/g.41658  ORF Transcript_37710/g.41658 Transcript_37710/m.41658 type:complete len:269 (+) Transcript_37710:619-1425(+)
MHLATTASFLFLFSSLLGLAFWEATDFSETTSTCLSSSDFTSLDLIIDTPTLSFRNTTLSSTDVLSVTFLSPGTFLLTSQFGSETSSALSTTVNFIETLESSTLLSGSLLVTLPSSTLTSLFFESDLIAPVTSSSMATSFFSPSTSISIFTLSCFSSSLSFGLKVSPLVFSLSSPFPETANSSAIVSHLSTALVSRLASAITPSLGTTGTTTVAATSAIPFPVSSPDLVPLEDFLFSFPFFFFFPSVFFPTFWESISFSCISFLDCAF